MTYPRDTEHVEKTFIFGGMSSRNGFTAATMFQNGFTGVDNVFVGDGNFLVAEPGSRYEIMLSNMKKFCVGFPIQSALDALTNVMAEHKVGAADVEKNTA